MIHIFSFAASCAGEKSRTAGVSDAMAAAFREQAGLIGETVSYERVTGKDLKIDFCRSCESCFRTDVCPLDERDDMALLKQKMRDCDILFIGTPVYAGGMSGLAKAVIDRIACWAHRSELLGKPCLVFATASSNHGQETADSLAYVFRFMGGPVVNGGALLAVGHPNLYLEKDMQGWLKENAERLLAVWQDPCSGIMHFQQQAFLSQVIGCRRTLAAAGVTGTGIAADVRICEERGLNRFVLLTEAIEELYLKPREEKKSLLNSNDHSGALPGGAALSD